MIHLLPGSFRYVPRQNWDALAKDLKSIYTASTEPAAKARFEEFDQQWGARYPAVIRLWKSAWPEFVPLLDYDVQIRRIISCHQPDRVAERPLPARCARPGAHFPNEQAAPRRLYPVTRSLNPTGKGRAMGDAGGNRR
ncbi:hypothetical protein GIS00_26420 [Nakamurella sp. YIM 132087]|uniref:Mutator family transposase n=1 Tax=Nakamurella alba TaxID=2665158 RepID=A0A7K1FTI3_9ACTN|nr:hypothetical protein [Nakamurella alba]